MPGISVIIPTHDRPHLLRRAVDSARSGGRDVEVVVVDDASVDETAAVCRGLRGIKYVRLERNQGVAGARNVGVLASSGEYVAFLDDDDLRLPDSLDLQVEALAAEPGAGFACGPVLLADQWGNTDGRVASPPPGGGDVFWQVLELGFYLQPASVVMRRECFFRVGLFNSRLSGIDDWDMWVRVAELFPVVVLDSPVCVYREPTPHSGQGLSGLAPVLLKAVRHQPLLLRLPRAAAAPAALRRGTRRRLRRRVADTLSWHAARRLPEGAYGFALRNFLAAARLSPLWAARPEHFRQMWRSLLRRYGKGGADAAEPVEPRDGGARLRT